MIPGNSSPENFLFFKYFCCITAPLIIPQIIWHTSESFVVDNNHFALVIRQTDNGKITEIYGYFFDLVQEFIFLAIYFLCRESIVFMIVSKNR